MEICFCRYKLFDEAVTVVFVALFCLVNFTFLFQDAEDASIMVFSIALLLHLRILNCQLYL